MRSTIVMRSLQRLSVRAGRLLRGWRRWWGGTSRSTSPRERQVVPSDHRAVLIRLRSEMLPDYAWEELIAHIELLMRLSIRVRVVQEPRDRARGELWVDEWSVGGRQVQRVVYSEETRKCVVARAETDGSAPQGQPQGETDPSSDSAVSDEGHQK